MNSKELSTRNDTVLNIKEKFLNSQCSIFFDIDGTLKGRKTSDAPFGFHPDLPDALKHLGSLPNISIGVATSQSPDELLTFTKKMGGETIIDIFPGPSIFEDGHLWSPKGVSPDKNFQTLSSDEAQEEIERLKKIVATHWTLSSNPKLAQNEWGFFPNISTPISIPTDKLQGVATGTIWEMGPNTHDSSYDGEYEPVSAYISQLITQVQFSHIYCTEVGNGTLRILEKGRSKATAFSELSDRGIIELNNTILFCDGANDIEAAKHITDNGGIVITVENAHPHIKSLATWIARQSESKGVIEALHTFMK